MIKLKCTSCNTKVNAFSKSLSGKPWRCPNCDTPVKMGYNFKMIAIWILPASIVVMIIKKLLIEMGYQQLSFLVLGVILSIVMITSMYLKPIAKE